VLLPLLASPLFGYIGIMGLTYEVVAEWFPGHRGMSYSLFIGGATSLGGAILSPLGQLSINGLARRQTYLVFALCILVIVFPAQYFLLSEPTLDPAALAVKKDGRVRRNSPECRSAPYCAPGPGYLLRFSGWGDGDLGGGCMPVSCGIPMGVA
jgi:MFS family permease